MSTGAHRPDGIQPEAAPTPQAGTQDDSTVESSTPSSTAGGRHGTASSPDRPAAAPDEQQAAVDHGPGGGRTEDG